MLAELRFDDLLAATDPSNEASASVAMRLGDGGGGKYGCRGEIDALLEN